MQLDFIKVPSPNYKIDLANEIPDLFKIIEILRLKLRFSRAK